MAFKKTHDSLNYENQDCACSVPFYVSSRIFFFLIQSLQGCLLLSVCEAYRSGPPKLHSFKRKKKKNSVVKWSDRLELEDYR